MSETIAITGKSVKLFKGHYTRSVTADGTDLLYGPIRFVEAMLALDD
ncbi:MAG: hypothetical protein ACREYE_31550 [Gammaproteobacteria bacterium]